MGCAAIGFAGLAMIKYLGSKRLLLPRIVAAIDALPEVRTVLDLFSGTARVGHALKAKGYRVLANDHCRYAAVFARCYVQADRELVAATQRELDDLQQLPGEPGWFTSTYCTASRYLRPENGARVEAIRAAIAARGYPVELEAVLLTALIEAADRVDSTTGVQMAFLKAWSERSQNALQLRLPDLLPRAVGGKGAVSELDALQAAHELDADVAYLDPPYNQHKYLGNYHVWETLARWDRPEVYGKAHKRIDCKTRKSAFNSKPQAKGAFAAVLAALRTRHTVVSFSDEGYFTPDDVVELLARRGHVLALACDYPRYVGARIGIHNPKGEKVGTISHLRNREFLFVATDDRSAAAGLAGAGFLPADEAIAPV